MRQNEFLILSLPLLFYSHLTDDGLAALTVKEMKQLESPRIRAKKHELILAETENCKKRIAENEKLQQLSMTPNGQDYAMQAYLSGNVLQLNMMQAGYPLPDRKFLPHE
ncbi:agamous-like MADS-box protein AGL11 isoform X3 [Salvia divinorum]|uniref:Agamous-like MADS-box protein AGL11 isoform X3 n=1 Tax=Salvia divinorum TaxID=28513 RepID=A0ABD1FQK8_SALDI